MYFAKILEKKFPDAKLTESYSGALIIENEGDLPIDKWNELNVIAAIQPKVNPGSHNDNSQILFSIWISFVRLSTIRRVIPI